MKLMHISVGMPTNRQHNGKQVRTSIFKTPVEGPVTVGTLNIEGDGQSDLSVHGGVHKAIYVYSQDYYADWAHSLGREALEVPQFGENLTVSGCKDTEVVIGARYRFGNVPVTVMQPRIPCFKLGMRVGDDDFANTFWERGRLGFYCKVDKGGIFAAGDPVRLLDEPSHGITIRKLYDIVTSGTSEEAQHAQETLADLDSGWLRRLRQRERVAVN